MELGCREDVGGTGKKRWSLGVWGGLGGEAVELGLRVTIEVP
jgi:hypothetical protein